MMCSKQLLFTLAAVALSGPGLLAGCSATTEGGDQLSFVSGDDLGAGDLSGLVPGGDAAAGPDLSTVDPDTGSDPDTDLVPDAEPDTDADTDVDTDVDTVPVPDVDAELETDPGPDGDLADADIEVEPEVVGPNLCEEDTDCPIPEDLQICVEPACFQGQCVTISSKIGTPCGSLPDGLNSDCAAGVCDALGSCIVVFIDDAACEDGDPCTLGDLCDDAGQCFGGLPVICPAESSCELALCDSSQGGCVSFPGFEGLNCEDGDPCTVGSTCEDTQCVGGENLCACLTDEDCPDDGDVCNGVPDCVPLMGGGKGCSVSEATKVSCAPPSSVCVASVCDPVAGTCSEQPLPGTPCDDGALCTKDDICDDDGLCLGSVVICQDEDPCTADGCDALTGACTHEPSTGSLCSDQDPCTTGDVCTLGLCAGAATNCDDGNSCTVSHCDPVTGACIDTPLAGELCDDQTACTEDDACSGETGLCEGTPIECVDGNICTTDTCLPAFGCVFTANTIPCDDGDACTGPDACKNGSCKSSLLVCDDGIPCTVDSCADGVGCQFSPDDSPCENGNPCTDDWCDPESGCRNEPNVIPCDDGDACTVEDECKGGACSGLVLDCNDEVPCTLDACDPQAGCSHTPDDAACQDENLCTEAFCDLEAGCEHPPIENISCDDGNPCTVGDGCEAGVCNPGENTCECQVNSHCDDTDLCNGVFLCEIQAGGNNKCVQVGEPVECLSNPATPCLKAVCNPENGACGSLPVDDDFPCPDNDPCTHSEACHQGACDVQLVDCDDALDCTVDSCNQDGGCEHLPLDLQCTDGVPCTIDTCSPGEGCTYTPSLEACDDGVGCTKDICDPGDGCQNVVNQAICDDGISCTINTCDPAVGCVLSLGDENCDDDDPCTTDLCVEGDGCVYTQNTSPCEDGNPCTDGDQCHNGICDPGTPVLCDDLNPCTSGACDPFTGICNYAVLPNGTSCEDGDLCTNPDVCQLGTCVIGPLDTCDDNIGCTQDQCTDVGGCLHEPQNADCDDQNPCTVDVCVPGQGCDHQGLPILTSCDDGLAGTVYDVCVASTCRGFQLVTAPQDSSFFCPAVDTFASVVSDLSGNFFAVVRVLRESLIGDIIPCDDESQVVALHGGAAPTLVGDALVDAELVGLSHDLTVANDGLTALLINQGSALLLDSDLAEALDDASLDDALWSDAWARPVLAPGFNEKVADRYVLVGRQPDDERGLVQICTRSDDELSCYKLTSGLNSTAWKKLHPVAVSGFSPSCLEGCPDQDPDKIHTPFALVSDDDGSKNSLVFLKPDGKLKRVPVPNAYAGVKLLDVLHLGQAIWVSGTNGLIARYQNNQWTFFQGTDILGGAPVVALTAALGHIFAVAQGDATVLLAAPMNAGPEAPWNHIAIGTQRQAYDTHATGEGLHVVGSQVHDGDLGPDNDALIWYLPF